MAYFCATFNDFFLVRWSFLAPTITPFPLLTCPVTKSTLSPRRRLLCVSVPSLHRGSGGSCCVHTLGPHDFPLKHTLFLRHTHTDTLSVPLGSHKHTHSLPEPWQGATDCMLFCHNHLLVPLPLPSINGQTHMHGDTCFSAWARIIFYIFFFSIFQLVLFLIVVVWYGQ